MGLGLPTQGFGKKGLPVYIDGTFLGLITNWSYLFSHVEPGRHLVWIKGRRGKRVVGAYFLEFEAGKEYFLAGLGWDAEGSLQLQPLTDSQNRVFQQRAQPGAAASDSDLKKFGENAQKMYERSNLPVIAGELFVSGLESEAKAFEALQSGDRIAAIVNFRNATKAFVGARERYKKLQRRKLRRLWGRIANMTVVYLLAASINRQVYGTSDLVTPALERRNLKELYDFTRVSAERNAARAYCLESGGSHADCIEEGGQE